MVRPARATVVLVVLFFGLTGHGMAGSDGQPTVQEHAARVVMLLDVERQQLAVQLQRLVSAVEAKQDVPTELQAARRLLTAAQAGGSGALASSSVVAVNSKLQLVVVNVGIEQGARVGMPMVVLRGEQVVARVRIVEVRQKIAGAVIENVDNNVTVQAGDSVVVTR